MPPTTEERKAVTVLPFGIEADHPRNCDLLIQCIPNCRLRSAVSGTKGHTDAQGEYRVPIDQARHLGSFPQTPGMQLHVNPSELTYAITDPMHGNTQLCDRVRKYLKEMQGFSVHESFDGCPTLSGKLDVHRMKSLCREMVWLVNAGEAKKAKGAIPSLEDIEDLPGNFLLNPGTRINNTQPQFEKDWDDWVQRLSRSRRVVRTASAKTRAPSPAVLAGRLRDAQQQAGASVRMEWFGKEVLSKINLTLEKRMRIAVAFLRDKVVRNISRPVTKTRVAGKGKSFTRISDRSKPGEFPKLTLTQLRKTIFSGIIKEENRVDGFVGTPLDYGLFLEVNSKLDRKFLLRTLNEERDPITAILTEPIK